MNNALINWILERLSENSTWRGIILILTACGIALDPDKAAAITAAGIALVGVINVFRRGYETQLKEINDIQTSRKDSIPKHQLTIPNGKVR